MTVSTQVSRNEYTGNGATTQYDFTFRILDKSHLLVQTLDTSENIVTLTLGTDYTVTGVNRYNGGKVVLTSALPAGYKISIERSTPVTQEASIRNQGGFFPEIHEDALDKLTMLVQQAYGWWSGLSLRKPSWLANYYDALNNRIRNLRDPSQAQDAATKSYVDISVADSTSHADSLFQRTLHVPELSIASLPPVEIRKNKIVAMNNSGDPVMVLPESGSAADVMIILASDADGEGADTVNTQIDVSVGEIMMAPSIITGRVNIKNPRWKAPQDDAEDPAAAAANVTAINMMLAAGGKHVELDDKARRVNAPLLYQSSVSIHGAGRSTESLVWTGGDLPIIARPNYSNKDAPGFSNVRLIDLKIKDQAASRASYYSIDLFNGNSSGLERCWLDAPGAYDSSGNRIITSDRYGVALGVARNSILTGSNGFVAHMRDSRITNGTLMINGTDWYVRGCELWGAFRNRAVEISGGGTIGDGSQIVPGFEAGIFLFSDVGYDIETLKIIGVYFDGSTDSTLFTGWGIKSASGIGLKGAQIIGCDFWHLNQGGILAAKLYSSTIESNFSECDSDDTGEDDIKCDDVYGSRIYNRHFRNTAPKKGDAVRVNLGKPYAITTKSGFPLSSLGGEVSFSNAYARCSVANPAYANSLGGSFLTSFPYGALPNASAMYGKIILVNGKSFYSDGAQWRDISGDATPLTSATNLHLLPYSGKYYASDITIHSNIPSGITGKANINYEFASAGYATLTLYSLKDSGGVYIQVLEGGSWGAWSKIA